MVTAYHPGKGPQSLDAIARSLGYPKSSLLRILDTLIDQKAATRDPGTGGYYATVMLAPQTANGYRVFQHQLVQALERMAETTGCTAEWYVPQQEAMVLVRREEPREGEVKVMARTGFIRPFTGELEAVACLGTAWIKGQAVQKGVYASYDEEGKKIRLSAAFVRKKVEQASKQGYVADKVYNSHGVRRMACVVLDNGQVTGILALAESIRPDTVQLNTAVRVPAEPHVKPVSAEVLEKLRHQFTTTVLVLGDSGSDRAMGAGGMGAGPSDPRKQAWSRRCAPCSHHRHNSATQHPLSGRASARAS